MAEDFVKIDVSSPESGECAEQTPDEQKSASTDQTSPTETTKEMSNPFVDSAVKETINLMKDPGFASMLQNVLLRRSIPLPDLGTVGKIHVKKATPEQTTEPESSTNKDEAEASRQRRIDELVIQQTGELMQTPEYVEMVQNLVKETLSPCNAETHRQQPAAPPETDRVVEQKAEAEKKEEKPTSEELFKEFISKSFGLWKEYYDKIGHEQLVQMFLGWLKGQVKIDTPFPDIGFSNDTDPFRNIPDSKIHRFSSSDLQCCPVDTSSSDSSVDADTSDDDDDEEDDEYAEWDEEGLVSVLHLREIFKSLVGTKDAFAVEMAFHLPPQWSNFTVAECAAHRVQANSKPGERIACDKQSMLPRNGRMIDILWLSRLSYDHAVVLEPAVHNALQELCEKHGLPGLYE